MKVIDLLNNIANGEEVPKKIKYRNKIFDFEEQDYFNNTIGYLFEIYSIIAILNDEVEILAEPKGIPEKLTPFEAPFLKGEEPDIRFRLIIDRINELIDYLKSKGEQQ